MIVKVTEMYPLKRFASWCFEPSQPHRVISGLTRRPRMVVNSLKCDHFK